MPDTVNVKVKAKVVLAVEFDMSVVPGASLREIQDQGALQTDKILKDVNWPSRAAFKATVAARPLPLFEVLI